MINILLPAYIFFTILIRSCKSSYGDRDYNFRSCLEGCQINSCNGSEYLNQTTYMKLLGWDCLGECQYNCMWHTIEILEKYKINIPQFYGKWPFIRFIGIQEPFSVLSSLLNLFVHIYGLYFLRKKVPKESPLFWFWHLFSLVCINGWIWSTVFHTRDTYFTELMDYFSAFSMVIFSFFSAFVRIFEKIYCVQVILTAVLVSIFYIYHVYYLAAVHFDYAYNMKANIVIGVLNAIFWLAWSIKNRKSHPYSLKCSAFIILALASISLEVNDFSPIYWVIDAHGLWHLSTSIITPIWYSFLIDDCLYLHKNLKNKDL